MFGLSDNWFLVLGAQALSTSSHHPRHPSIDRSINRSSWSERACYTIYSNGTSVWLGPTSRRIHPQREVPISDRVVRYRLAEEPQQAPFGCSSRLYLGKTINLHAEGCGYCVHTCAGFPRPPFTVVATILLPFFLLCVVITGSMQAYHPHLESQS